MTVEYENKRMKKKFLIPLCRKQSVIFYDELELLEPTKSNKDSVVITALQFEQECITRGIAPI